MFSKDVVKIIRRLQAARLALMVKQPFYAVLLLHMQFSLDPMCETVYTDGTRIAFCPDFLEKLSDSELEYVLMHEVMHAALNHCSRKLDEYDFDDFGTACDIVVNSNILNSCGGDLSAITLKDYGVSMHLIPEGKEGFKYTAEEVYRMLQTVELKKKTLKQRLKSKYIEDDESGEENGGVEGNGDESAEAQSRKDGGFDDHTYWGEADDNGSSHQPSDEDDQNEAGPSCGSDGEDGDDSDGTCENNSGNAKMQGGGGDDKGGGSAEKSASDNGGGGSGSKSKNASAPNTGHENSYNENASSSDKASEIGQLWMQRMVEAAQIAKQISIRSGSKGCGSIPLGAERLIKELTEPQTDWKTILENFIQEEITDYSFNPPDRRFQDSPFLLPDYNEKDDSVKDILFMIDTSGSMSDEMITQAYSEIKGALDQFNGHLAGWLGFFDAEVVEPKEFATEEEFEIIRPKGCGGTSFHCIFKYIEDHIDEGLEPADIIILTDGYAPFPDEEAAMGIPVLWLINNEEVDPPWGKVARIKIEGQEW